MAANGSSPLGTAEAADNLDPAEYLVSVMADIDAEVRRRRASGDLPAGLERELDELFLEFSPWACTVGPGCGRRWLWSTAPPTWTWPSPWSPEVGRKLRQAPHSQDHQLVYGVHRPPDREVRLGGVPDVPRGSGPHRRTREAVDGQRTPELPTSAVPEADSGPTWWSPAAVAALTGTSGRVVHGECGSGFLLEALAAAGTDAYGVDPNESAVESAVSGGLDVRAESVLDHLDVVADESLSGIVLSGSVQWLHPNERDRSPPWWPRDSIWAECWCSIR